MKNWSSSSNYDSEKVYFVFKNDKNDNLFILTNLRILQIDNSEYFINARSANRTTVKFFSRYCFQKKKFKRSGKNFLDRHHPLSFYYFFFCYNRNIRRFKCTE